jgi:hypothetical protein
MLGAYVDELIILDNLYLANLACVEFVNLMVAAGNLAEAARILDHLDATGALDGALPWRALVADAAAEAFARPRPDSADHRAPGNPVDDRLDDRQALGFMRDVLERLAVTDPSGG